MGRITQQHRHASYTHIQHTANRLHLTHYTHYTLIDVCRTPCASQAHTTHLNSQVVQSYPQPGTLTHSSTRQDPSHLHVPLTSV